MLYEELMIHAKAYSKKREYDDKKISRWLRLETQAYYGFISGYEKAQSEIDSLKAELEKHREAGKALIHLHGCEMEGLSSGQPTREQWLTAVDNLSNLLYPTPTE